MYINSNIEYNMSHALLTELKEEGDVKSDKI